MQDYLWAVAFATAAAQVTLKMGSSQQTFLVSAGVTKLKLPSAAGKITVQMTRSGQTIVDQTPAGFTYITNPVKCRFFLMTSLLHGRLTMPPDRQSQCLGRFGHGYSWLWFFHYYGDYYFHLYFDSHFNRHFNRHPYDYFCGWLNLDV